MISLCRRLLSLTVRRRTGRFRIQPHNNNALFFLHQQKASVSTMTVEDSVTLFGPKGEKTIVELVNGDLTRPPPGWKADLLLVSAFPNDYTETPMSLIGALARNQGISISQLANDKQEDLRYTLECWVSKPLPKSSPYHQIMLWEPGFRAKPEPKPLPLYNPFIFNRISTVETVESIFAAIIAMAEDTHTLAMPILGAGDRGSNRGQMLAAILYATQKWVKRGLPLKKITICMYGKDVQLMRLFHNTKTRIETTTPPKVPAAKAAKDASKSSTSQHPSVVISYDPRDEHIADRVAKAIELIDSKIRVEKLSAELDTKDITQEESTTRNLTANASKVIALLTSGYVRNLGCRDHFNECYLSERSSTLLEPIIVDETALPNYMQMIQCHDARPDCCIDKLFSALVCIVKSISETKMQQQPMSGASQGSLTNLTQDPTPVLQPLYDVFISYSSKMRAQARAVHEILEYLRPNTKCFFDVNDLRAGIRWQQGIYNSLDHAEVFLFVLTPEFASSAFCSEEAAIASLRAREGQLKGIVALEAIPLTPTMKQNLPKEVRDAIVSGQTPYQACKKATDLLQMLAAMTPNDSQMRSVQRIDSRLVMHKQKEAELDEALEEWERVSTSPCDSPTVCIVGHETDAGVMALIRDSLERALCANENFVQIITGPGAEQVQAIDNSNVIVCVLSQQFLKSPFFMNCLNVGILRNRTEGGCLIPIHIEPPQPECTPTYVRLMPAIDASMWNMRQTLCNDATTLLNKIAGAAKLSGARQWKCRTTVVALQD